MRCSGWFSKSTKIVLVIDEVDSESVADITLDALAEGDSCELVLIDRFEGMNGMTDEQPATGERGRAITSMSPSGKALIASQIRLCRFR
jgi:hypothetical protein